MYVLAKQIYFLQNICKIVNQKKAQQKYITYNTTISFYDIAPFRTKICLKFLIEYHIYGRMINKIVVISDYINIVQLIEIIVHISSITIRYEISYIVGELYIVGGLFIVGGYIS